MKLVIDLPPREEQIALNRRRWEEVCADPELAKLPGRVETNAFGQIVMTPPPSGNHSFRQSRIGRALEDRLGGLALPECPISTIDGVRAADVGWYSEARFAEVEGQIAFERAPEICVEVVSPSNTPAELAEKRQLYFEAGADEVWFCQEDGSLEFFLAAEPATRAERSRHCPEFPAEVQS